MTDFRALCAELVEALSLNDYYDEKTGNMAYQTLLSRARTALAEPQPAPDGEVAATGKPGLQDGPAVQSREPASVVEQPSDEDLRRLYCELFMLRCDPLSLGTGPVRFARAVLARWGTSNLAETRSSLEPIPVSERLPEANTKVLAHYFNALGKGRTICAIWVPAKSRSEDHDLSDDDFTEYDEEDDKFYWPEGWYEAIENWDELGWVKVYEGEIAYWQPLPKWPAHALPLPKEVE